MLDAALRVSPVTSEEVIVAVMTIAGVTSSVGQPIVRIFTREPQPACKLRPNIKWPQSTTLMNNGLLKVQL